MTFKILADTAALLHLLFIVFVVFGGLLLLRWPALIWLHVPAAIWGVVIEVAGLNCPLTRMENYLLRKAGRAGYSEGFVAHYIFAFIYPQGLTRGFEMAIAAFVLLVNLAVYVKVLK